MKTNQYISIPNNKQYIKQCIKQWCRLIMLPLLFLSIPTGCSDVLNDVKNLSSYPEKGTFDDETSANAFLSNIYYNTLGGWPVNSGNNADESVGIQIDGWITLDNDNMKNWSYESVRKTNILLKEVPQGKIPSEKQRALVGQAKFLRAFLYFKMIYHHGGVPIIKTPQLLTDDLKVIRNSTKECFDFIIDDLDEAFALLPAKYQGTNRGRVDQASVKAFKGRVLLYKASPQFNPSNYYDNAYWTDAFNANKEAKDFLDLHGYGLLDKYTDVFETKDHKENILSVIYKNPIKMNGRKEDAVRPLSESKNYTGGDQPIWALAEAYTMMDGRKIGDSDSKYEYKLESFWKNRDPRFDATLVWNGAIYELGGLQNRRQYTMAGIARSLDAFGFFIQGEHFSRSGLYCRKGIMEELSSTQVELNDVDWPEIRYAEVLFNYAEAANEAGNAEMALDVLKSIRKRAGIEAGSDGLYGLKYAMNRGEMRQAIIDEKYIEMAFEGHRFWDLRRHRMLGQLDGMRKYGIMAVKVNGRTVDQITSDDVSMAHEFALKPEDFEYQKVEMISNGPKEMVMPEKYYFFPIKQSHINANTNLKQNKDWGGDFIPTL